MKIILDFLSLPLGLPISPIWSFLGMIIIGEVAFRIAYSIAGDYGSSSAERSIIHWIARFILYFGIWALACVVIIAAQFIAAHWIWFAAGGVFLLAGCIVTIFVISKKKKTLLQQGIDVEL